MLITLAKEDKLNTPEKVDKVLQVCQISPFITFTGHDSAGARRVHQRRSEKAESCFRDAEETPRVGHQEHDSHSV